MSFNLNNKYKLNKYANGQTSKASSLPLQFHTTGSSYSIIKQPNFQYVVPMPFNKKPAVNTSSYKLTNNNSIINQTIESSNKLDELLKRCRAIKETNFDVNSNLPVSTNASTLQAKSLPSKQNNSPTFKQQQTNLSQVSSKFVNTAIPKVTHNNLIAKSKYKLVKKLNANVRSSHNYLKPKLINNFNTDVNYTCKFNTKNKNVFKKVNKKYSSPHIYTSPSKILDINILLGRNVNNISKNKFKFINKKAVCSIKKKSRVLISKYSLVRTNKTHLAKQNSFLRKFNSDRVLNIKGTKFKVNKNGKKLRRLSSSISITNTSSLNSKYKFVNKNLLSSTTTSNHRVAIAYNLISKSKMTINRLRTSKQTSATTVVSQASENPAGQVKHSGEKKYCLFYNRFGRCSRGDSCTYLHDPNHVALCPRFLRGTCKLENCPYSHNTSPEKLPLCSYFASGCCNRDNCPYSHVFYGKDAEFCIDFAKGFCPLGIKCNKPHINECPDYDSESKKCPRGKKCPLVHRNKKAKLLNKKEEVKKPVVNSQPTVNVINESQADKTKTSSLDYKASFISFQPSPQKTSTLLEPAKEKEPLKLRPTFGKPPASK